MFFLFFDFAFDEALVYAFGHVCEVFEDSSLICSIYYLNLGFWGFGGLEV